MARRRLAIPVALALALCGVLAPAAAAAAPPRDRALALAFRPQLLFDAEERWRPLDVDRFLAEPGHAACPPAAAGAPVTSAQLAHGRHLD